MDEIETAYGLKGVELSDKPLFDQAFALLSEPISDYTFANTFIWRTGLRLYWKMIEGHLCVFANTGGDLTMLLPPIGEGDLGRCLRECFQIMNDYNARAAARSHSRIEYVSEELAPRLLHCGLALAPMSGDYVYETRKMIELAGGELKSKRQAKGKFLREHVVWTEPLGAAHVAECKRLLHAWLERGDARASAGDPLALEAAALRRRDALATELALEHREELGLVGMVVWADGRLAGFTLGEALTPRQASVIVEKTDLDLHGSAQFIFSEFCRQFWSSYPEVNAGDDWGIPSLRWTKESYRPCRILPKYVATGEPAPFAGWTPCEGSLRAPAAGGPGAEEAAASGPEEIEIGPARFEEVDALVQLEREVFGEGLAITRRQMRYLLRTPRALAAAARTAGGRVVGWAIVLMRRHREGQSARLYSLAVDPRFRGRGVGRRLVCSLLDAAASLGVKRIFLEVAEENEAARRLYERLGFVTVATLPNYYGQGRHGRRMLKAGAGEEAVPGLPRPLGLA